VLSALITREEATAVLGVDVSVPENDLEIARKLAETAIGRLP
jgi:hypothetical protein